MALSVALTVSNLVQAKKKKKKKLHGHRILVLLLIGKIPFFVFKFYFYVESITDIPHFFIPISEKKIDHYLKLRDYMFYLNSFYTKIC